MTKTTKNNFITCGITLGLFVIFGILSFAGVLGSQYSGLLVPIGIYIILSISLNLTVGILGELSLGHAGFMCVGAYAGGIFSLLTQESINPSWLRMILALIVGGLAAAAFGVLIGIPVLRLRGDYLAIVTLGFGEIIKALANNIYLTLDKYGLHFSFASAVSGTDSETSKIILEGAKGIKAPQDTNLILVVVVLMICMVILMNFINSRTGRACMAVRDNYIAAQSVGINVTKFRLIAFTVSAAIAGVAGVLYAHSLTVLAPKKFDDTHSGVRGAGRTWQPARFRHRDHRSVRAAGDIPRTGRFQNAYIRYRADTYDDFQQRAGIHRAAREDRSLRPHSEGKGTVRAQ